jgi:hypothetical protein
MANQILANCGLWVAEYNLCADANRLALTTSTELLDNTALCDAARSRVGGLQAVAFQAEGYWAATPDGILFADVGLVDVPVTIAPASAGGTFTPGDRAFLFRAAMGEYSGPNGAVGELGQFSVGGEAAGLAAAQGFVMFAGTRTTTLTGTSVQAGAATATQTIQATLHVTDVSGSSPTLAVVVQSDDNAGFTTPTTRITFDTANATANRSQHKTLSGPVTDTYWRIVATLGGSSPNFTFACALGIR